MITSLVTMLSSRRMWKKVPGGNRLHWFSKICIPNIVLSIQVKSKDAQSCVDALNHFIGSKDDVQVVYTDNSPELIRAIKDLGYRHQTSIEYVDSSKSFIEREVRQMLEGARSNLLQSGLPLKMWPLAMQHHATAINASPQLDGSDSPWQLRFGEEFPAMNIPFGAKVLFWNNPKRADNTSGKLSPTSNEGIFLGYHIQPGHDWKGEYLVAKLEAADYHVNWGAFTIQRTNVWNCRPRVSSFL